LVFDYWTDFVGGAQTAFKQQILALEAAGHEVTAIVPQGIDLDLGASHHLLIYVPFSLPGIRLPVIKNTSKLQAKIDSTIANVDVVHLHSEFGLSAACIDVASKHNIPVIFTVHTFFWRAQTPRILAGITAEFVKRFHSILIGEPTSTAPLDASKVDRALRNMTLWAALRADAVISPSEHQAEVLRAAGVKQVFRVVNTTTERTEERPAALTSIEGPLKVLWVARFAAEKQPLEFIEAVKLASLSLQPGQLEVTMAGDGDELAAAQQSAATESNIKILGQTPRSQVQQLLVDCHLSAITSYGFDNQPMTVIESLYACRPMLYVDPNLKEGLDQGGLLCEAPSVEAMAAKLVELAENHQLVIDASQRARAAYEIFTPEHFVVAVEAVYGQAILGKKR